MNRKGHSLKSSRSSIGLANLKKTEKAFAADELSRALLAFDLCAAASERHVYTGETGAGIGEHVLCKLRNMVLQTFDQIWERS